MLAPHSTLLSGIFFNSTEQFRDVVNSREVRALLRFSFAGEQLAAQFANPSHHKSTNRMQRSTADCHSETESHRLQGYHRTVHVAPNVPSPTKESECRCDSD